MLRTVTAVVGDRVAAFELGVLSEVFGLDRSGDGLPTYDFTVCAVRPGRVPTTSGYDVHVEHGLERLERADLVAVPAWTSQDVPPPAELVDALHRAVERGALLLGVCSGAFLLAAAGLLDGRRAATHWRYAPDLAARHPAVLVDAGVLYVQDGPVVTSAGTAAAIDACLHLVRAEHGAAVANALARRMVVPPHRSGGQAQFVESPVPAVVAGDELTGVLAWMRENLAEPMPVDALAARALMSARTFARRFRAATGTTPHRWLLEQRLLLAEHLLEETDLGVDQVARRCGLGGPDALRHHFALRRRVSPTAYRRSFRAAAAPA
ncbi:transcriptional regulator GlxA family with amidase domain [Kineococcus xinjiangensis]|uniref:Transcriptional regulator GlxA family with amidase domain n=1 Tax=Kineococcus xinjiangensis TaxID=512762 RepID=A0A2S6IHW1_9ACTN|nr:helix-turn-helix domain-containing protein [Kineococcus xinjiangensis]PPK93804.1 transcriptional regulator GlxA family with amidase domain [Kineococcus xinjiangensis]